jgi:long-chain acyl-CoA synthetase
VQKVAQAVGRGISMSNLCTVTEGDDRKWSFVGVWSKNRREWLETHLANMYFNRTTIGFFDSMGNQAVDFILNQTELSCIFCTPEYISKLVAMKKDSLAKTVKSLVSYEAVTAEQVASCAAVGVELIEYSKIVEQGLDSTIAFEKCTKDDCPMFSYTSGTTGDSKGVKLTHANLCASACSIKGTFESNRDDILISYLPYPHSFEAVMTTFCFMNNCRIGYYSGDPARLTEDCQKLKPTLFPSVPRLYNRIYGILKGKLDSAGGCKTWLANRGIQTKLAALRHDATYTNGCYDKLVFRKICDSLGGNVKHMITASAPIDQQVLEFFKVCFCCPVLEGYGLTETSGGAAVTAPNDPVVGHVGGPLGCVKWRLKDVPEMQYLSSDKPYPRGELCMKGATVTTGYYKRPDKTAEAFDEDGWFKTGDVALVYPNGSVKIIDRSKNIFKLSQGEYIAPEKVENIFALCPFVAQSMVYGDSLKNCCVAIVVPEESRMKAWAKDNGKLLFEIYRLTD